jgi:dethiobiotin synthetase
MAENEELPEFKPLRAPWTPEQVDGLNRWQTCGHVHEYTCGNNSEHVLVATEGGWVCPVKDCGYTQDWAHEFSVEPPPNPLAGLVF